MKPLVLLSNDDGFAADGLRILRQALLEQCDVVVCAPATEQSGTSHAISLNRPLRLVQQEPGVFSVDGTPADCVYVALNAGERVLPRRPSVVVSGLNHGLNLGNDVFYSGTVAAAREGALKGLPGIAVSTSARTDRHAAARFAVKLTKRLIDEAKGAPLLLNVNFPAGDVFEAQATSLGTRRYTDGVSFRHDPRGGEYLWIGTGDVEHDQVEGTDTWAFDHGIVGVTPLSLELWGSEGFALTKSIVSGVNR